MKGIVKQITDESIFVEINAVDSPDQKSCSQCGEEGSVGCSGCAKRLDDKTIVECRLVSDEMIVVLGEEVEVQITPTKKIESSAILFLVPIIVMFLSFKLSLLFTQIELINGLSAIAGLAISVIATMAIFKTKKVKDTFKPTITKIHFD